MSGSYTYYEFYMIVWLLRALDDMTLPMSTQWFSLSRESLWGSKKKKEKVYGEVGGSIAHLMLFFGGEEFMLQPNSS